MLPNKIVAHALIAILAIQVLGGLASAQPTLDGADLMIEEIEVGANRIAGVPAKINITVRNIGDVRSSPTGWQIFVGLNGLTDSHCIERGESSGGLPNAQEQANPPCYIRMLPAAAPAADGTNRSILEPGQAGQYVLVWNASLSDATTTAIAHVEIGELGSTPGSSSAGRCPDQPNCSNNQLTTPPFAIGLLGVRARPVRENATGTNSDENTAWQRNDIGPDERCSVEPAPIVRGCRVPAGRTVVALYRIINSGTVRDAYTGAVNVDPEFKRRGYIFELAPQNFSLGRAEQTDVRLTIVIPENESAGRELNVDFATENIRWTSNIAPFVNTNNRQNPFCQTDPTIERYCRDPNLPSLIVDVRRGFNLTANETFRQITPGRQASFNLTVNNTGNADDTFNVSILQLGRTINDSWVPTVINASPFVFPQNTSRNFTIQVTPPLNATNGTYHWDVGVKSFGDRDGSAKCKANNITGVDLCTVHFTAHLEQSFSIAGIDGVSTRVVPGETVTYELGIRNDGNGYDNVTLELQTTVAGWDVRLSDRVARLTPFNTTPFTLTVTSPPNVEAGTEAMFYVNATSGGPIDRPFDQRSKAMSASKMTILRGPNLRVSAPLNSSFIDPGSMVSYDVNIQNVGNVADNFTIPIPQRPSDWGVTVYPPYLALEPNQAGTIRVNLSAPNSTAVGERANAIVTVRSTVDPSRVKSLTLEGRVSGPDLFVDSVLVNSTSPYAGDPLEVSVVVGNNGNKGASHNSTLRLVFVQDGAERLIGEKIYAPNAIPGQRRLVENFAWDTTGIEGAGVLMARIDVNDEVAEIDETAASNEKTRALTLRTFDIKLTPAQGLSARPGEKITYGESPNVVIVEYRGNQPSEPVTIRFESEHGWLSSQAELSLALPRGTPIPIIASIDVPARPGAGKDTLTVTIVPTLRPMETLRATTVTTVLDEERPIITSVRATPAGVKLGETMSIDVFVEDATGISAVTAYVTLPTNETNAVVLREAAEGRWNATRAWTIAGSYIVRVEAADEADPPNFNKTRQASATFVVSPGSAPTIRLAPGQASTVRAGTAVSLAITDPLGIGKVVYTIKGVSYDLRGPDFAIDTSTFAEGPVDIMVTAENIYGIATTQRISLTVDNVAPGITKVTMSPDRPRANEDVTLTIGVDSTVQAVDVLIKRDGQVIQSINATRRGSGTFEAKFNPGEGDFRVDVTARDAAGNTKLAEGAVVFSAKPGSPFKVPALPVPMLALALAAVALLARQRRQS